MHTDVGMLAAFWTWPQTELAPISSFFESKSNRKYKFFLSIIDFYLCDMDMDSLD